MGFLLARAISRPIHRTDGGYSTAFRRAIWATVPVRTDDEPLGQLAASFNQMSADLATSNQLRRQMTADIAHELRTPLSVILGYTEALADGKLPGKPDIFDTMHDEARMLNLLIDDLRTLSLADAGEFTLDRTPAPTLECLERTAAAHEALASPTASSASVQAATDVPLWTWTPNAWHKCWAISSATPCATRPTMVRSPCRRARGRTMNCCR